LKNQFSGGKGPIDIEKMKKLEIRNSGIPVSYIGKEYK
jgi:hypothetical protein